MDFEAFVRETLKDIQKKQEETLVQAIKTNGRVNAHDEMLKEHKVNIDSLRQSQSFMKGGWAVAVVLGSVIGFLITNFLIKH